MKKYTWYELHKKLAEELYKFFEDFNNNKLINELEKYNEKFNRSQNNKYKYVGELFFLRCKNYSEFSELFNWTKNITEESLDPFHIFASFNNNNTTLDKKIERLQFYFKILNVDVKLTEDEEDSRFKIPHIPVVQVLTNREKEKQNEIWEFFSKIIIDDKDGIEKGFISYKNWYGIGFSLISEFLFWIDSSKYISLDKNTQKLLLKYNVVKSIPKNYDEYINLIRRREYFESNIFRLIVQYSYDKRMPTVNNDKEQLLNFLQNSNNYKDISNNFSNTNFSNFTFAKETLDIKFQLIALNVKDSQSWDIRYKKNLEVNELYKFNQNFDFGNKYIKYFKNRELNLFDIFDENRNVRNKININAIVGRNGTGKSTLIELAFMIINNLSFKLYEKESNTNEIKIDYIENIFAELYFFTSNLYKITIENNILKIESYQEIEEKSNDEEIYFGNKKEINTFDFSRLYYTEHINYSLHSLNQNYFGDWIHKLFHKNDGYKTPIVIEPYRKFGNIDINTLNELMKDRLLFSILSNRFKGIVKDKNIYEIEFSINREKFSSNQQKEYSQDDYKKLISVLEVVFKIEIQKLNEIIETSYLPEVGDFSQYIGTDKDINIVIYFLYYILNKLEMISKKYDEFNDFTNFLGSTDLFENYLKIIKDSKKHSCFKIKRAIYSLKFLNILNYSVDKNIFTVSELSSLIENEILAKNTDVVLNDILIPSFFRINFKMQNGGIFENLSSGEKQKIFIINSILYHLRNIASIDDGYLNVNIVLDEIELYFHPEMQKDFIFDLIFAIKNSPELIGLELNFLFVTHSPFILSDIPRNFLLKLDLNSQQKSISMEDDKKTYASNIYDLLNDSFFMDGFIGKLAEKQINQVINLIQLYKYMDSNNQLNDNALIESYNEFFNERIKIENLNNYYPQIKENIKNSKNKLLNISSNIGEIVIRNKLNDEIKSLFESEDDILNIVNDLRSKNYNEIKTELNKYTQNKQSEILKRLFENQND